MNIHAIVERRKLVASCELPLVRILAGRVMNIHAIVVRRKLVTSCGLPLVAAREIINIHRFRISPPLTMDHSKSGRG